MNTRILLGALLGVTAIAAVPSAASASASCTYDAAKREMKVRYGASDTRVTVANHGHIKYAEGSNGLRDCFSSSGTVASAENTDKVVVLASSSATAALAQTTTLDETQGNLQDGNAKLQLTVLTGTGGDRLIIRESGAPDALHLMDQGGLALGPAIDLDYDGDVDLRMTTSSDAIVQVNGGGASDFIDATGVRTYHTVQLGEDGNDGLLGGTLTDGFNGGPGEDTIRAQDGLVEAINGGTDTDGGTFDFSLDQLTSIEHPGF